MSKKTIAEETKGLPSKGTRFLFLLLIKQTFLFAFFHSCLRRIVHEFGYGFAVCTDELLLQISKSRAISLDIIFDVSLQILHLGYATLEQRVEDDFLAVIYQHRVLSKNRYEYLRSHSVAVLVTHEPNRPPYIH